MRIASELVDKWAEHRRQAWVMAALYFAGGAVFAVVARDKAGIWFWFIMGAVYVVLGVAVELRFRRGRLR